ncbi:MAG: hypothetical protein ACI8XO_002358 [Verrucomicrobiales bacterium]
MVGEAVGAIVSEGADGDTIWLGCAGMVLLDEGCAGGGEIELGGDGGTLIIPAGGPGMSVEVGAMVEFGGLGASTCLAAFASILSTVLGGAMLGSALVTGAFGVSADEMAEARLIRCVLEPGLR